jgi:hypothetical protein
LTVTKVARERAVEITCRLKTPVPGIESVRTVRPLASRPMRKPRNPHENPRPLFDAFSRKPSGKRADFRNRQAKFMYSKNLEVDSVEVYVGFPQLCPWSLGTACLQTREKLARKIGNGKRPGGREEFWFHA